MGCSHATAPARPGAPPAPPPESDAWTASAPSAERVAVADLPAQPPFVARPEPRQRLTRTITLGQTDAYGPMPAGAAAAGQSGPLVVNNVTVVHQQAPVVYGGWGYGGYGYGGQGYGGERGVASGGGAGGTSRGAASSGDGWGGAQTTAAPGRTPSLGGNWAPPPSYGPRTMR